MKVSRHHSADFTSGVFSNSVPRPKLEFLHSNWGALLLVEAELKPDMMKDACANFLLLDTCKTGFGGI